MQRWRGACRDSYDSHAYARSPEGNPCACPDTHGDAGSHAGGYDGPPTYPGGNSLSHGAACADRHGGAGAHGRVPAYPGGYQDRAAYGGCAS